jgi:hypothetical protein
MNVFDLRDALIDDYSEYISSFIQIRDKHIKEYVGQSIDLGLLWPDPLIQLNPTFEPAAGSMSWSTQVSFTRKANVFSGAKKTRMTLASACICTSTRKTPSETRVYHFRPYPVFNLPPF